ncbi:TetR/AcrR family transcriptional regulator [Amycolatopsis anabasis]|uniref:TetR/AcrR family transcriptional regulator n=1 Tax=Amycolatopsis anabasis TaxID=1840409 RepID=UPI00131BCBA1|nr:TetR/AcrR family transcriptional regulator [Amycolatopsis anabasis]
MAKKETDHRKGPRRRGPALERAIFEATLAELADHGYAELSLERVATRARTGNASLYRRWRHRAELVVDALLYAVPDHDEVPDSGDVREDVLEVLRRMLGVLNGPVAEGVRGLLAESLRSPEATGRARARLIDTRQDLLLAILRNGVARGQVRPEAVTPRIADVAPALIAHEFILRGRPVPDETLTAVVDEVLLPLITPRS